MSIYKNGSRSFYGIKTPEELASLFAAPFGRYELVGERFGGGNVSYGDMGKMLVEDISLYLDNGSGGYVEEYSLGEIALNTSSLNPILGNGTIAWNGPGSLSNNPFQFINSKYDENGSRVDRELGYISPTKAFSQGYFASDINIHNPSDVYSFTLKDGASIAIKLSFKSWQGVISHATTLMPGPARDTFTDYPTQPYDTYVYYDKEPLRPLSDWGNPLEDVTDINSLGLTWTTVEKGAPYVDSPFRGNLYKSFTVEAITPILKPGKYAFAISPENLGYSYNGPFLFPTEYSVNIETSKSIKNDYTLIFAKNISKKSRGMFKQSDQGLIAGILNRINEQDKSAYITRTSSTPLRQAEIMFDDYLVNHKSIQKGYEKLKQMYGNGGDRLVDYWRSEYLQDGSRWVTISEAKQGRGTIVKAGEKFMIDQFQKKGLRVSNHVIYPSETKKVYAVDIAPSSITEKAGFVDSINQLKKNGDIMEFLYPSFLSKGISGNSNSERAFHIEFLV